MKNVLNPLEMGLVLDSQSIDLIKDLTLEVGEADCPTVIEVDEMG